MNSISFFFFFLSTFAHYRRLERLQVCTVSCAGNNGGGGKVKEVRGYSRCLTSNSLNQGVPNIRLMGQNQNHQGVQSANFQIVHHANSYLSLTLIQNYYRLLWNGFTGADQTGLYVALKIKSFLHPWLKRLLIIIFIGCPPAPLSYTTSDSYFNDLLHQPKILFFIIIVCELFASYVKLKALKEEFCIYNKAEDCEHTYLQSNDVWSH